MEPALLQLPEESNPPAYMCLLLTYLALISCILPTYIVPVSTSDSTVLPSPSKPVGFFISIILFLIYPPVVRKLKLYTTGPSI